MEKLIVNFLVRNGNVKEEERELIEFGLKQGFISIFSWTSAIVIGVLMNMFVEVIVFSIAFSRLRSYAGGYHARSQISCYFFSMFVVYAVLNFIKFITLDNIVLLILSGIACAIIFLLSPIGDENKELDDIEIVVYGRRARITLVIEIIIALLLMAFNFRNLYYSVISGVFVVALSLVSAVIIKKFKSKKTFLDN